MKRIIGLMGALLVIILFLAGYGAWQRSWTLFWKDADFKNEEF